jgi:hypothetical protein
MKYIDRFLQRWRIKAAAKFIPPGARVLDIGSWQGELADLVPEIADYWGIDPKVDLTILEGRKKLVRGYFPDALVATESGTIGNFNAVTMLAVLEHIPIDQQSALAHNLARVTDSSGRLIITVPSPIVDRILPILRRLRLIDGMSLDEHFGFDVNSTVGTFQDAGFKLLHRSGFQLGCNNLFVFERN